MTIVIKLRLEARHFHAYPKQTAYNIAPKIKYIYNEVRPPLCLNTWASTPPLGVHKRLGCTLAIYLAATSPRKKICGSCCHAIMQ